MPYCISDGFAQSMLVKVKSEDITVLWEQVYYKESQSVWTGSSWTTYDLTTISAWTYLFSMKVHCTWWNLWWYLYKWSATSTNQILYVYRSGAWYNSWEKIDTLTASTTIKLKWETWNTGGYLEDITISKIVAVIPRTSNIGAIPREIEELWDLWTWTLYWNHIDWSYHGWIITWTTESATTWSVSLWNAVWYLEINYNWQIVKVPYYS